MKETRIKAALGTAGEAPLFSGGWREAPFFLFQRTPRSVRAIGVLSILAATAVFPQESTLAFFFGLIAVFVILVVIRLVSRFWLLLPVVRRRCTRKLMRFARETRKLYLLPPESELLYIAMTICVLVLFIFLAMSPKQLAYTAVAVSAWILAACAGLFDFTSRLKRFAKKAWAKRTWLVLITGLTSACAFVSTATVNEYVYQLTHASSKNFVEFVGLSVSIMTPLLVVLLVWVGVMAIAMLEMAVVLLFLTLTHNPLFYLLESLADGIIGTRQAFSRFAYRLCTGRRAPDRYRADPFGLSSMRALMRPVGLMALVMLPLSAISDLTAYTAPSTRKLAESVLLVMHYHENTSCNNLPRTARIAELSDRDEVSVAAKGNKANFQTRRCVRSPLTT